MLKIFKPNWLVIEVNHERYTFNTYYTYCRHKTLKEIEDMFMISGHDVEIDRDGNRIYDECYYGGEGTYDIFDDYLERHFKLKSYQVSYTIIMPARNIKKDTWFITGQTKNKFGLFDREWIRSEEDNNETSTDK